MNFVKFRREVHLSFRGGAKINGIFRYLSCIFVQPTTSSICLLFTFVLLFCLFRSSLSVVYLKATAAARCAADCACLKAFRFELLFLFNFDDFGDLYVCFHDIGDLV
jgi:hypothetical protein